MIEAGFRLAKNGDISFRLGSYDHHKELIIDPALTYATYLDKLSLEVAAIATDSAGNTYVTGLTGASSYETTPGAFQTSCTGCGNNAGAAFVTKIDPTGTHVLYSTFLGGSSDAQPFALAVDRAGNAILSGSTGSADFPLKNPIRSASTSPTNPSGFLTSLNASGNGLNYSSLFRGDPSAVALDAAGNAYFAGRTDDPNFPVTPGALKAGTPNYAVPFAFVMKVAPRGSLLYSSLIGNPNLQRGGEGPDGIFAIEIDASGNAYLAGSAGSLWPTTGNAYQSTITGSQPTIAPFVAKLNPDATHILFSTFVGSGHAVAMVLDAAGRIFLAGVSDEAISSVAESTSACLTSCAFLRQLSADGSQLLASTALGRAEYLFNGTNPKHLALDPSGNVWLSGQTSDPSFPLLHPLAAVLPVTSPLASTTTTGFVTEFDSLGTTIKFSTFYGGSSTGVDGLAIDPAGVVHLAGTTVDGIYITPGAPVATVTSPPQNFQYTYGYLAAINPATPSAAVCLASGSLQPQDGGVGRNFSSRPIGITDTAPLELSNCGELPLQISSVTSSNAAFAIDASGSCAGPVAPSETCTVQISYTATSLRDETTTMTVTSNASIPVSTYVVVGSGTPRQPSVTPSSVSMTFSPTAIGATSAAQTLTLTNTSGIELTLNGFGLSPPFALGSNCGTQLDAGATCTVTITFTPEAIGSVTGPLFILDNALDSPVTISLSGTGTAPTVGVVVPPASATQTVAAGQAATYALTANSVGNFAGQVTFSCSSLPLYAACSFSPASVAVAVGTSSPVVLTISTRQANTANLRRLKVPGELAALALAGLPLLSRRRCRLRMLPRSLLLLPVLIASLGAVNVLVGGCSSSHVSSTTPAPAAAQMTPAGTYVVTVVASGPVATVTTQVSLIVQ